MKKILTILSSFVLLLVGCFSIFAMTGCDFEIDYKKTSAKLKEITDYISKSNYFVSGGVKVEAGYSYNCQAIPNVAFKTTDPTNYVEIEKYYDTAFAYSYNYILDSRNLLSTSPTVDSLTEQQENIYKDLNEEIDDFFDSINDFEHEIENINRYYRDMAQYGVSSKEAYLLNYKESYKDFIQDAHELIEAIDKVADQVYNEVDYKEINPIKETYKSFIKPINLKIIYGYFNFIVDSFDCRVVKIDANANEHKVAIVNTYNKAKETYINYFKKIINGQNATIKLTEEKINDIRTCATKYFEEMELFQKAHDKLDFVDFFFEDECDLDGYVKRTYANLHYFNRINDYMNYTIPSFTEYLADNFYN